MSAPPQIFLGRQPVIDRQQALHGYRLSLRSNESSQPCPVGAAFSDLGLTEALEGQFVFLPADRELLSGDELQALAGSSVVLEVPAPLLLEPVLQERCAVLKQQGYRLALSQAETATGDLTALGTLADYAEIDVQDLTADALSSLAALLHAHPWKLVACGVDSQELRERCEALGFDYLQGYYFARPVVVEGRKLDSSTTGLLKLIDLLNSDAELSALEAAFKGEPGLTVNLLRLVNSVGMGSRINVSSVRHAISVLGQRQLLRWLQLLMFSSRGNGDGMAHNPLMQHAALRGYVMEELAEAGFPGAKDLHDQAFLTGLLSLVPAVLGLPLPLLLEKITVGADVRNALLEGKGNLGLLLSLATAYDNDDLGQAQQLLQNGPITIGMTAVSRCLTHGLSWLRQLTADAS